jgi:HK97 family phage portal protein
LENPAVPLSDKSAAESLFGNKYETAAGITVTEANALNSSGVFACVNVLSQDVAKLPCKPYRRTDKGKEVARDHSSYRLLHHRPNNYTTSFNFRQTGQAFLALWGNFYARIERNGAFEPVALHMLHPADVTPFLLNGEKYFTIHSTGETRASYEILHVAGLGFDGVKGMSVVQYARQSIGLGLATEKFGAGFFGAGATVGGALTTDQILRPEQRKNIVDSWKAAHHGPNGNHGTALLEGGLRYDRIGIPPSDAQFLETRQFQLPEIARWFRMPLHKIQDLTRSTNNNIEHQSIEYVTDTLQPWLVNWEQQYNLSLFREDEQEAYFVEHNLNGLLRGDVAARSAYYNTMTTIGAMSINEVRALENQNAIEGGDKHYRQLNLVDINAPEPIQDNGAE